MKAVWIITLAFAALICHAQEKKVDVRKLYEKGEAALDDSRYQEALSIFNKCLEENPGMAEAYFSRAAAREQLKDYEGAHTDYNIYLEMKPNHREALFSVATLQYRLGRYEQSKENLLKLLSLPGGGETTKVYFRVSASTTGKNQIMTAQSAIKPQVFNYLGMVETKLKNYKAAIVWLDSAIMFEGKEADYYVNRAMAKEAIQDTTAMADYKKALQLNPEHTAALHNIAVGRRAAGDSTSTLDNLEKAIDSDSSMLYPYLARAYQRMEGGYFKGALEDYNKALEINDRDPDIWLNRGLVKEKLNDLKGAYSDYTMAIELNEKFEKAWLNRANVQLKQGKFTEAIEDYSVVLVFNADYAPAYYNRAIAKQRLKQSTAACEDLLKAEQLGQSVADKVKKEICK